MIALPHPASAVRLHLAERERSISVCLPARNEQATIGAAVAPLAAMKRDGLIDQLVVCDQSDDWTADIAYSQGAEVYRAADLIPECGPVLGKGDNMWRSLLVLNGEIVLWLDADSTNIQRHFVFAMVGPILSGDADFVKGYYRRPLGGDPDGGGRLNHLFARPLIAEFFPELAFVKQPLAGETAMTNDLAMRLPFESGWAIEPALTIDAFHSGARITNADLGVHEHRHWPLRSLADRCPEVMRTLRLRASHPWGPPPPSNGEPSPCRSPHWSEGPSDALPPPSSVPAG